MPSSIEPRCVQEQQQQASPHVLPPEEEDFIWDEAEEAEVMAVLDEDIKEFEEELAERPAVTPAEIKALWQEAVKHQEEVDRPHLEAQLDRGVLDFDMDEPRTISHAGAGPELSDHGMLTAAVGCMMPCPDGIATSIAVNLTPAS